MAVTQRFEPLFRPRSVTFIGASKSPMKWGFIILSNLIAGGFKGNIYPVNPRESEILNLKVYPSVDEVPEVSDLAVIVTPPSSVPPLLKDCLRKGIRAAVVITAGFAEVGGEGERLQREMADIARRGNMILVGPNCNGIMSPNCNLYPMMPPLFPKPGHLGMVTQSGNVGVSIISRAMTKGFGLSYYVSSGNEAQLTVTDFIDFFGDDPQTKVILSYVEGVRDGRRFLEVARRVTRTKPIVMIKVGETTAGARAAFSHTAALAGSNAAFSAAARQAGIIRAKDMDELFNIAAAFVRQPLPKGRRVGIVTGGGGLGVLAAEACAKAGLDVVQLPEETIRELDSFLPPWWSRGNPVDLVAGLRPGDIRNSIEALLRCHRVDGVIVLGISGGPPRQDGGPTSFRDLMAMSGGEFFQDVPRLIDRYGKPVLIASDTSFGDVDWSKDISAALGDEGLVCYSLPEHAAVALSCLAQYGEYLRENGYQ